jgi:hypothetical protein
MSESPEVPDEEPSESNPDMKERMRSFGEKAKAFGEKTGQRSKELGKKVAEATKETTAKAADATKRTTAKVAEAAKETTAKAAEAGKKAGSRLSESTADVSEKISVAAEQAVGSVSKGVKQTKEKVKQAKEARDERKAQSAQVPQSTQVIALGPDLPEEGRDHQDETQEEPVVQEVREDRTDVNQVPEVPHEEPVPQNVSAVEQDGKQYVILPPTGASSMPTTQKTNSTSKTFSTTVSNMASTVGQYGPDLVFGWFLLFVVLCTLTNVFAIVSGSGQQIDSIPFGMPHFDLAFDSDVVWAHYVGYGLLLVLLFDSIMLSFSAATLGSYRRILIATVLVWALPAITNGPTSLLTPFETNDLLGFLWHILVLPIITLTATIRVGLMLVERESDLPPDLDLSQPQNNATRKEDILHRDATPPLSSNMTIPKLPFEDEIMNATDELMQKPRSRDKMEPYEFIFFMFMWVFLFAGIALLGFVGTRVNTSGEMPGDPFFFVAGACFAVCVILSYIVFKMDRSARSGIDMAKRRERYNAMQDEAWETKRVQYRLAREDMEHGMAKSGGTPSDA